MQMVAMNYQTSDLGMLLYSGRFKDNGKCGYVFKPASWLKTHRPFTLRFTIICATHLPKLRRDPNGEVVDPYIKLMYREYRLKCNSDAAADQDSAIGSVNEGEAQDFKTEPVIGNGMAPFWNRTFEWECIDLRSAMLKYLFL